MARGRRDRNLSLRPFIYTQGVGSGMTRLRDEYNRHTVKDPVEVFKWRIEPHDRFLVIDDRLYHCGHSLNATGSKLSAIMLMGTRSFLVMSVGWLFYHFKFFFAVRESKKYKFSLNCSFY